MPSNENWVRDQVLAAHEKIEGDRRREALRLAVREAMNEAYKKKLGEASARFSKRALDRVGAFLEKEFGTQDIGDLATLPRSTTDTALNKFSDSFINEIEDMREKESRKQFRGSLMGTLISFGGVAMFFVNVAIGVIALVAGLITVAVAFGSFRNTPTPVDGNPDLYLSLRCQQAAGYLQRLINETRADLGL